MSPEDVGQEFSGFLGFGLTKPTGLETYTQMLTELSAALGRAGRARREGVPDRDQDTDGSSWRR